MRAGIELLEGDITALAIDALVNAANQSLLGGGGVDGAIHRAAGPQLRAACAALGGCPTGEARITPGFALPARWVIHTVGPVWSGGGRGEDALLAACYRASCELALANDVRSIAFPCISTGAYRFPKERAAHIALDELGAFATRFERVVVCCFGSADADVYRLAMKGR